MRPALSAICGPLGAAYAAIARRAHPRLVTGSQLVQPGLPISGTRLSDQLHRGAHVACLPSCVPVKGDPSVVGVPLIVGTPVWVYGHVGVLGVVDTDGVEGGLMPLNSAQELMHRPPFPSHRATCIARVTQDFNWNCTGGLRELLIRRHRSLPGRFSCLLIVETTVKPPSGAWSVKWHRRTSGSAEPGHLSARYHRPSAWDQS